MADELTTKRIINLPAESAPAAGDVFVVDNEATGTKKLPVANLIDPTPTEGSAKAVSSGGVYETLQKKGDVKSVNGIEPDASGNVEIETGGLSNDAITALLACFANVAWTSGDGDTLYDNLSDALLGVSYSISYTLTNCSSSNTGTTVQENRTYTTTITANEGYELDSVVCTMGGVAQTVTEGVISIAHVTGDIVITATASEQGANVGYIEVGTPTIENGILTPSDGNYVISDSSAFDANSYNAWELQTKIYATDVSTTGQDIAMTVDSNNDRVRAFQLQSSSVGGRYSYSLFSGTGNSSWDVTSDGQPNAYIETANMWYWLKVGWDGSAYYVSVSTDGENYTKRTATSSTKIGDFNALAIGKKGTATTARLFAGKIDLNETRFYADGSLYWEAI